MSMSLVGISMHHPQIKAIVLAAKEAGFSDYNERVRNTSIFEAIENEPHWRNVVIDSDGDFLLGYGATMTVDTLEEWKEALEDCKKALAEAAILIKLCKEETNA